MKLPALAVGAACSGALLLANSAQAILIDNFDSGPGTVSTAVPGPTNFASIDAIGGSRTLEMLGFPTDADPTSQGATLEVAAPVPGVLAHSQNAIAPGGRSKVTWDNNGLGLGGVDLTDLGQANGLMVDLLSIDVGNVDVTFMIEDIDGQSSELLLSGLAAGTNQFLFSDFIGNADFETANNIMLRIDADATSDLTLDLIETVAVPPPPPPPPPVIPEPVTSTLGVMGLAALGMVLRRRSC